MWFFVVFSLLLLGVSADDPNQANRIDFLPGISPQPSYPMYSGYINLDNGQNLVNNTLFVFPFFFSDEKLSFFLFLLFQFYWLIEAEEGAADKPLMLWLNGGFFHFIFFFFERVLCENDFLKVLVARVFLVFLKKMDLSVLMKMQT